MRTGRWLRAGDARALGDLEPTAALVWSRAFVLGGATFLAGLVSHLAGDGLLPSLPALFVLAASAVGVASVLVLTRATRTRVVLALVGGQAVLHLLLSSLAGHRAVPGVADTGGWWAHQVDHLTAQGGGMVLAHTVGAALLGLFLAHGEQTLWRGLLTAVAHARLLGAVRGRARASAAAATHRVLDLARGRQQASLADLLRPTPTRARPQLGHRGPPALLAG